MSHFIYEVDVLSQGDAAMDEEYRSLMANDTWDLVPLPKGRKLVKCKWIYKTKYASDGSVEILKARFFPS